MLLLTAAVPSFAQNQVGGGKQYPTGASASKQNFRTLKGVVSDDTGAPLPGASVVVQSTRRGVATDVNGGYSITIPDQGAVLVFSFVGMKSVRIAVGSNQTTLNVKLESDNMIEDVVIEGGFGLVQNREDLTGSAFQVTSAEIAKLPAERIDKMLTGLVPGLVVEQNNTSGSRDRFNLRVRGEGSLSASCEPLWIVDGIPVYTGGNTNVVSGTFYTVSPLSFLNPDDIESITVLKDAATTSLYGADGANGVILVTTKKGKAGEMRYNASVKYGVTALDRSTVKKFLNAEQWWELAREGWVNSGRPLEAFPYRDNEYNNYSATDTDWYDVYYGLGSTLQVNLSASGGSEKMSNYVSGSYYNKKSAIIGDGQSRYSLRAKSDFNISKWFTVGINLGGSYSDNDVFGVSKTNLNVIPIFEPYDNEGMPRIYNYYSQNDKEYSPTLRKFVYSEVSMRDLNSNKQRTLLGDASLKLTLSPVNGLSITSQTGFSYMGIYEALYYKGISYDGMSDNPETRGYSRRAGVFSSILREELRANYNRIFGRHKIQAIAGIDMTDKRYRSLYVTGKGFPNDYLEEISFANKNSLNGSSSATNSRSLSYLGFVGYSFGNRYSATFTYRKDGASSFSKYAKWDDFWSAGAVWNIHNEEFFRSNVVNLLNLKFSYGSAGNSRVDTSSAYGTYTMNGYYGGMQAATQSSAANPGLSWETTYTTNIGVSVGLFKRLEVAVELYNRDTRDMLYNGRVSGIITDGTVIRNVGEMNNKGIEFNISSRNIATRDFSWDMKINGSSNRNVIKKLYKGMHTGFFDYVWMEGASKNAWWLVRWAGVDPTDGSPMWYDIDGNLTYAHSYDNRVLLPQYSKIPALSGGMVHTFRYKMFSLRLQFTYDIGGWDLCSLLDDGYDIISVNAPVEALNHWREAGDRAVNPRFEYKHNMHTSLSSTRNLYRKTNIQLTNAALTFAFPEKWCRKLTVRNMSLSVIGDNLYLWTPAQSSKHNSYKTLMHDFGVLRSVSAELSVNF